MALLSAAFKVSAAFNLVRGQARPGRASRSRVLRVACLALAWSVGETAALTVLLCLWIASGFGGRLGTESYQARHYMVMRSYLNLMYRVAQRACGLRVRVAGPTGAAEVDLSALTPNAWDRLLAAFVEAVRTGRPHPLDAAHGLHLQALIATAQDQLSS